MCKHVAVQAGGSGCVRVVDWSEVAFFRALYKPGLLPSDMSKLKSSVMISVGALYCWQKQSNIQPFSEDVLRGAKVGSKAVSSRARTTCKGRLALTVLFRTEKKNHCGERSSERSTGAVFLRRP